MGWRAKAGREQKVLSSIIMRLLSFADMAEDAALRANRLALLKRMQGLFMHAADLSRLPG